jgi:glutathione S-transferase
MEIWGRITSSNVQKVLWRCSELNLSYQRHDSGANSVAIARLNISR